jgi:hypothetical protein
MDPQLDPIYIGGAERSGTNLLYALLTSHPRIAMTRRTNLWTYFYNQYGDLGRPENFERCLAAMMHYKRLRVLEPDPERISREFWLGEPGYPRLFALIQGHYAEKAGKPRWGDKSLDTERYADGIFASFPAARIIHIIRDPRDRYASALKRWKVSRGGEGAGAAVWLNSVRLARRNLKRYPDRYMVVRYETLVAEPETTVREVCAFIGEEFVPDMLKMDGASAFRDEGGNSSYGEREPGVISTDSIGRYRQTLSPRQIALIQAFARRAMLSYGYSIDPIRFGIKERLLFNLVDRPANLARMLAWHLMDATQNQAGRSLPAYRIVSEGSFAGSG